MIKKRIRSVYLKSDTQLGAQNKISRTLHQALPHELDIHRDSGIHIDGNRATITMDEDKRFIRVTYESDYYTLIPLENVSSILMLEIEE